MITREEWDEYSDDEKFQYAQLTDGENERMKKVLRLIPECPHHGWCLSHMEDWIKSQQASHNAMLHDLEVSAGLWCVDHKPSTEPDAFQLLHKSLTPP